MKGIRFKGMTPEGKWVTGGFYNWYQRAYIIVQDVFISEKESIFEGVEVLKDTVQVEPAKDEEDWREKYLRIYIKEYGGYPVKDKWYKRAWGWIKRITKIRGLK